MHRFVCLIFALSLLVCDASTASATTAPRCKNRKHHTIENQWAGRRVAYLGDSITDKKHVGTTKNYWQYLEEMLGIEPLVYGINGHQWNGVLKQAVQLKEEHGQEVDAILVFAGTNDFNAGIPLGEWYDEEQEVEVEVSADVHQLRRYRVLSTDSGTFRGRINAVMTYLKANFPTQQIILITPLHRAYARFGNNNIQPDESYCNRIGEYVDAYVEVVKEAANVWAVPVINLNSISGLYPLSDSHVRYFHNSTTDRLHPNADGHYRMAKTLMYQLLSYPADFR